MRLVSGPTPPGTGDTAEATSATSSYATSPTSLPSTTFVPTSTTTAPGATISPRTSAGRPAAAITSSPSRTTAPRSTVRVWQTVTVACSRRSSSASGFPVMLLRPTITARRPSMATSWRWSSSMTARGVAGASAGRPR